MASFFSIPNPNAARRLFMARSGLVLSGAAVALGVVAPLETVRDVEARAVARLAERHGRLPR